MAIVFTKSDREYIVDDVSVYLNLLGHAQLIDFDLGSQCGGHGVCGKDKVIISDQKYLSKITDKEKKHLLPSEIESGVRLACQCFVNVDADIIVKS